MEKKHPKQSFLRAVWVEIRDSLIASLLWNMISFIPRIILRLIKMMF
ncbi:hypothetical protein [Ammoniphilus sp. YIM 78166]|nr:hypothetical protein [Ammoniphilus sp. YIM 78166]